MACQLDLFTGAPCAELNAHAVASAPDTNRTNAAESVLLDLLRVLENELYHSGSARLLAAEMIRNYFEADKP